MAVTAKGQARNRNRNVQNDVEFEPSDGWVNPGYWSKDSEGDPLFISLPKGGGIPFNRVEVKDRPSTSKNEDWRKMENAKNAFAKKIQAMLDEMEPGEERFIDMPVQIRKVGVAEESSEGDNEHLDALDEMFG